MAQQKKIALWHRYGPADHTEEYAALPKIIDLLAQHCEVHYFGMKTSNLIPESIKAHAIIHQLPFIVDRASMRDKFVKTLIWYMAIPVMSIKCRILKIDTLYIDESLPLSFCIIKLFFRKRIARTLTDFFLDIYFQKTFLLRPFLRLIKALEINVWRRLDLIITRVEYTRKFLTQRGINPEKTVAIFNPCDLNLYCPNDKTSARKKFGFTQDDMVIAHHGILHPNKANGKIIKALASMKENYPNIKYLLIGSGPEMENLRTIVKETAMEDRVIFTGWLRSEKEVCEALNTADIGLVMRIGLESDNYHVTNTLVHEMACGLPIISANLAGVAEIITDGEDGLLFDPNDMDAFKAKLSLLINDKNLRSNFGKQSLELAHRYFDMHIVANKTAERILKVVYQDASL